jgi:hypothetical protein
MDQADIELLDPELLHLVPRGGVGVVVLFHRKTSSRGSGDERSASPICGWFP